MIIIISERKEEYLYLVLEEDFIVEGEVVLEAGVVYQIYKKSVQASNGISYLVQSIPVEKHLSQNYPENKFVVYYDNKSTLEKLISISKDHYKPSLLDNMLFITTYEFSIQQVRQIEGVTKVRYQRVGKLLNEKVGN